MMVLIVMEVTSCQIMGKPSPNVMVQRSDPYQPSLVLAAAFATRHWSKTAEK